MRSREEAGMSAFEIASTSQPSTPIDHLPHRIDPDFMLARQPPSFVDELLTKVVFE